MVRFPALCRALGMSPARVEQMIARGIFSPKAETTKGRAREWDADGTFALIVFDGLYGASAPAVFADELSKLISPRLHGTRFLVAYRDPRHNNGGWSHEIVDDAKVTDTIRSKGIPSAVVIDIGYAAELAASAVEKAAV